MQSLSDINSRNSSIKEVILSLSTSALIRRNNKGSLKDLSQANQTTKDQQVETLYAALYGNFYEILIAQANDDKAELFLHDRFPVTADFKGVYEEEVLKKMLNASEVLNRKDGIVENSSLKDIAVKIEADISCNYLSELKRNIVEHSNESQKEDGIAGEINRYLDKYQSPIKEIKVHGISTVKFIRSIRNKTYGNNQITLIPIKNGQGEINRSIKGMPGIKVKNPVSNKENQQPYSLDNKGKTQEVIKEEQVSNSNYTKNSQISSDKLILQSLKPKADKSLRNSQEPTYLHETQLKVDKRLKNSTNPTSVSSNSGSTITMISKGKYGMPNYSQAKMSDSSIAYEIPTTLDKAPIKWTSEMIKALQQGDKLVMEDTRNEMKFRGKITQQLILELEQDEKEVGKSSRKW